MPTLFISYKRGTAAVAPLMERLRKAHYRLWFDRDEIHLGDPDWQARIDQGLEHSDGVILGITPLACASEPVQYEVKKALELGKPIFPLVLERIIDYDAAIRDLGLPEKQHIEDFTDVEKWEEQVKRLLRDLEKKGLRVTLHDRRQVRDRDNPNYMLHQTYLKRLVERIGTLNLAQINPENAPRVDLERVYVDSPTGLSIGVKVQNWQVVDWWINSNFDINTPIGTVRRKFRTAGASLVKLRFYSGDRVKTLRASGSSDLYERASLEAIIPRIDQQIADYREAHPNTKPTDTFSRWHNGEHDDQVPLHLNHLAAARDRLVILGAPGSGKSTFVKYLALCLAGSGIDDWTRPASIEVLDNWSHGTLTPVYIELRHFVTSQHFPENIDTPPTADHLWNYIQHEILGEDLHPYADDLRYDLEHGHALLILDGLDEVPYPESKLKARQTQLINLVRSLNTRYTSSRIIVASRPYAYEGWTLSGFEAVTISAFEDAHRIDLAQRLYHAAGLGENAAQEKAKALNQQLRSIDPELKDRPLFVTLMATIYLRGESEGLPTRRGALYRESILLLLDRWTQGKPGAPSLVELLGDRSLDALYRRLAALAYDVHNTYGEQPGTPEIDEALLYKHLKPLGRTTAAELIPYLSENAGVLVSPGQDTDKDVFHFAHRTFQEYLAGEHLVAQCIANDSFTSVREHIMEKPQVWRVPCTLAGNVLADTYRRGDLWDLLDDLLDDEVEDNISPDDPCWWTVWLASVVLLEQKMLTGEKLRRSERAVCDQLRDWTLALIETAQALSPVERATCGRGLNLLGDPRPGVGVMTVEIDGRAVELPQIEWCDVPAPDAGMFIMGADNEDNPRREVEMMYDFKMAKYQVTYQQFQTFMNSGEYDQPPWWEDFPEDYQPQEMAEQLNRYANHPRDTVSWYQAVAFSRWLTAKYRDAGLIANDVVIRLPTEQEWEYAARGTDAREYPYPGEFDATKGNTFETGIGQTSAVGLFPDGASPFGALDMSGNVSEWCLNKYEEPQQIGVDESGNWRVLRGGSWNFNNFSARAASRDNDRPSDRDSVLGFRLCRAPSR